MQLRACSTTFRAPTRPRGVRRTTSVGSSGHGAEASFAQPATVAPAHQQAMSLIKGMTVTGAASLALAMGFMFCPEQALANDLGKTVFNGNCAACHQGGKNSVIPEKTLDKAALEQYLAGGFKLDAIIYQVNNGKGAMPAWQDRLDEEEIEAVAKYVYDTAAAGAWDSQ